MATPVLTGARAKVRTPQLRLFVALWPDAALQQALHALGAPHASLGRRIAARNLHVTLAFLGGVDAGRVDELAALMRQARPPRCEFVLDRLGYFAQSRVMWTGASEVPAALVDYQARLTSALGAAGFRVEKRAFRLHVSLLRDAAKPAGTLRMEPLRWTARDVALVQSELAPGGSRYKVIRQVPAS